MFLTKVTYSMISGASVNVMDFGATGNGSTDDTAAIQAAIDYCRLALNPASSNHVGGLFNQSPYQIFFPAGKYKISTPLVFDFIVDIVGETNGSYGTFATQLVFSNTTAGLVFLFSLPAAYGGPGYPTYDSITNTVTSFVPNAGVPGQILNGQAATGWAVHSSIKNLSIQGSGATGVYNTTFAGIESRCSLSMNSVYVKGFKGPGLRINASNSFAVPNLAGGANGGYFSHCQFDGNDGHGLYVVGGDANINTFVDCQFTNNKGWGVYDQSSLGNTYMGGQSSYNAQGSYGSFDNTGRCLFLNVYSEDGLRHSGRDSLFIGGVAQGGYEGYSAGVQPTAILGGFGGQIQSTPWKFRRVGESPETSLSIVASKHEFMRGEDEDYLPGGANWGLSFQDSFPVGYGKVFVLNMLNQTYAPFWISAPTTSYTYGTSAPIPGQFTVDSIALRDRRQTTSDAAPTSGNWAQGDIVWNKTAASGGYAGWICTASGTPGTWNTFGLIS